MTVNSVTALTNATATSGSNRTSGRGYEDMGQEEFFRLLTVQIQNQDPLDPVDNKEMLAQMAQFTSLSGINEMGTTLEQISAKLDILNATQAAAAASSAAADAAKAASAA